jgi:hypothetical protein
MTAPTDPQRLSIGLIVHNQTDVAADLIAVRAREEFVIIRTPTQKRSSASPRR